MGSHLNVPHGSKNRKKERTKNNKQRCSEENGSVIKSLQSVTGARRKQERFVKEEGFEPGVN